jgi:RimJ/RimL family protein N-acetyltransferase
MTGRLLLQRPVDDDATAILDLARDPAVALYNPLRGVDDLASARQWCRDNGDEDMARHATWVAFDEGADALVATVSIYDIDHRMGTAGIGYRVAPHARGQQVARRCLDTVARWSFAEHGLARLHLMHVLANVASCRVAEATGFRIEGTTRSSYLDSRGARQDEHLHGRLATDPHPVLDETVRLLT